MPEGGERDIAHGDISAENGILHKRFKSLELIMMACICIDVEPTREWNITKVSIFLERFFSHPHLFTCHVVISYSSWKWLNRAGKESHSLCFLLVSYRQVEAILNGCQADGPQSIVWVELFQSLCTFLRHSVNPLLLSKVFTDQIEVKKKNKSL